MTAKRANGRKEREGLLATYTDPDAYADEQMEAAQLAEAGIIYALQL